MKKDVKIKIKPTTTAFTPNDSLSPIPLPFPLSIFHSLSPSPSLPFLYLFLASSFHSIFSFCVVSRRFFFIMFFSFLRTWCGGCASFPALSFSFQLWFLLSPPHFPILFSIFSFFFFLLLVLL